MDISEIMRAYSPAALSDFSLLESVRYGQLLREYWTHNPRPLFALITWTNIAWRHLGLAKLEELEQDKRWLEILDQLRSSYQEAFGPRPPASKASSLRYLPLSTNEHLLDLARALDLPVPNRSADLSNFGDKIRAAIKLLAHDNDAYSLVNNFVFSVVALDNPSHQRHQSVSVRDSPGVVFLGRNCSEEALAEAFVHEADHQRVYELQQADSLVVRDTSSVFASPWRTDLRPANGLVLGASAFVQVSHFWRSLMNATSTNLRPEAAGQRSVLAATQAIAALESVLDSDRLTDIGLAFCTDLKASADNLLLSLQHSVQFTHWQTVASEAVTRHLESCRANNFDR